VFFYFHTNRVSQLDFWEFHNPVRIHFESGSTHRLDELLPDKKYLLVTTPGTTRRQVTGQVGDQLNLDKEQIFDETKSNPPIRFLEEKAAKFKEKNIEAIIGLGGGSAMDTAKTFSFLLANPRIKLLDFLQTSGPRTTKSLPVITIPTTAGTGSEVTPFATLWDKKNKKKYSLSNKNLFPERTILDPELTLTLPAEETVAGALDALAQGLEAIWNKNYNPPAGAMATAGCREVFENLPAVLEKSGSLAAREGLARAALFSGLAISTTKTALAHSISYPLTAHFGFPHGLACALTLPAILEFNRPAGEKRLQKLALTLECEDIPRLKNKLMDFLEKVGLDKFAAKYIPSRREALELTGEMYTPERAENSLRVPDENDLQQILSDSLDDWLAS